ncbi:SPW repeat protein [Natrialbaceae archaeon GCM10025810]|uniref:SPW repeat protein n=1 Tax=Halovalidus salilacus TaxID=3075124 RepID=UPI00361B48F9
MSDSSGRDDREDRSGTGAAGPGSDAHGGVAPGDRTLTDEEGSPGAAVPEGRDPRDESTQIASEERRRSTSFVSGIVAVIGAWVAASPFLFDVAAAPFWNDVLVGAVIFCAGAYNYYRLANDIPLSVGVSSLAALLGLWLLVAAPLFGMSTGPFWSTIASGLLVTVLAGYDAYEARQARSVTSDSSAEAP